MGGAGTLELVRGNMADNDQFRILIGGTATNAGYAEIATADDATEPIYVRQYSGTFTSLVRSATLLDASGNTSFPGSVTASSFIGNASSASNADTVDNLHAASFMRSDTDTATTGANLMVGSTSVANPTISIGSGASTGTLSLKFRSIGLEG